MAQRYIVQRFRPRTGQFEQGLVNRGLNPEEYESLSEEEYAAYVAEDWSKLESFGMGVASNIGGGLAGAAGTLAMGAALTGTGVGAGIGIPLMLGAGVASWYAGSAAQGKIEDALLDDEELAARHAKRRDAELANPLSYFGGQMAPALISFRPSPAQLGKAFRGTGQALTGRGVGLGEKQALGQMGFGSAIDTGFESARQLYEGEFDPGKLGMSALIGATLQRPTIRPKGIDSLIARGREKAKMRPIGSMLNRDPDKVFNLWAEPIPSTQQLKEAIGNTGTTSIYNQGKIFTGEVGVKVGIIENAAAPTPYGVVAQIEHHVTGGTRQWLIKEGEWFAQDRAGVGILDPTKVGPAAESMRRPGIGKGPLTLEEAAAAQGVTPKVAREIYGVASAKEAEAIKLREEGVKELEIAVKERTRMSDADVTYSKREKAVVQAAVNKAEKKIAKADKALVKAGDITTAEKTAINKLFSGQARTIEILDPITGKPRKVKAAEVDPAVSARIVDRHGEPLHERADVWPKPRAVEQLDPVRLRMLEGGQIQKAVPRRDGNVGWVFAGKAEVARIQKQFQDHIVGIRKSADAAKAALEARIGKPLPPINKEVYELMSRLALVRGFNLARAISNLYTDKGQRAAGFQAYDTRTVVYDPKTMGDDLIQHEGFHGFLDDLQYSTNTKDQRLREKFLKLFESEERAVEFLGRAMAARVAKRKEATFRELLRETKLRWKDKFGMKLTPKQLKDYLLIKYEHDHPFIYNKELVEGFMTKRLGKKPTDEAGIKEYDTKREALMHNVQAGNPVTAGAARTVFRLDDPWKDLNYQAAKKRFNSRGEEVVSNEEGLRLMQGVKRELGIKGEPETPAKRSMIDKLLQDTEGIDKRKFQEVDAAYERALSEDNTQALRAITEEGARLGGYNVKGYHGTKASKPGITTRDPIPLEFETFDYDRVGSNRGLRRPEVGLVHVTLHPKVAERVSGKAVDVSDLMGDLPSTPEAIAARSESLGTNVLNVYFKAENPLHLKDTPSWDVGSLESLIHEKAKKVILAKGSEENAVATMTEHRKLTAISEELQALEEALVEGTGLFDAKVGKYRTGTKQTWSSESRIKAVAGILKKHGYDSVSYQNTHETAKAGDTFFGLDKTDLQKSYILFNKNQIKSADPVVRDTETGNVIPPSKRFSRRESMKYQAARGERTISALDEGFLFASSRDRSRHMAETFDKFGTSLEYFDPERTILIGGDAEPWSGIKKFVDPVWWVQRIRYAIAETDQLLVRPFEGLKNAEITDATKKMALYVRDAHNRLEMMEKRYVNMFTEPLLMSLNKLSLSKADKRLLGRFRYLRKLVKKNFKDLDSEYVRKYNTEYQELYSKVLGSSKLSTASKVLDDLYVQTREEHIANGPKVKIGDHWRNPKEVREGYYEPFMLSRDATTILKKKSHTKEGKDLHDKILKFWLQQREARVGLEDELRNDLAEYVAVISNKDSFTKTSGESVDLTAAAKFNALRKAEGLFMPPDLVDPDPFIRAQRYISRFAKDMSWFTQIEDDHIVRAIRDIPNQENVYTHKQIKTKKTVIEPTTPSLKELFGEDVDLGYSSRAEKTFRNLDETHAGFHQDIDIQVLRANRMITSQWLGALSGVRDITTSFMNDLPYMRLQDMPLILKSFTHLGDAWRQSHISGANRSKLASIEFAHDSVDRAADAMATIADFSQKWSGRELFERGTRAIQFNLGKLLIRSYLNSGGKDPHIQRVLNTMGRMADVDTGKLQKNPTTVTEGDLNKLATAFVEINQGTYGTRGVPSAMIRGKSSWFLSLSRWSVEKFNRYMKDVIMPAGKDGDFKPLIKATLGAAVTGEALQAIANMMNAKESYQPSMKELIESDAEFEEFIYHAMHIANLSGYFGVLSGLGNDAVRMLFTGKAAIEDISAITFPALEALLMDKGIAQSLISYGTSGNIGDVTSTMRLMEDIMTNLNQTLRIGRNQMLANTESGKMLDEALGTTYFKGRTAEFRRKGMERDLKVFNRLYRGEHTSRWFANIDRYKRTPATNFKYSTTESDMRENVKGLMENAWQRSKVRTGIDKGRFDRLLKEGYSKPARISPNVKDAFSLREAQMFADFIARLRSRDAVRSVIDQEDRDTALSVERKRIIMESLREFILSKQAVGA